jgi:hypothetical protein
VVQHGQWYENIFCWLSPLKAISIVAQGQQSNADGSNLNGSQARVLKRQDSLLAPGMNKYSTPKAPADES